MVKRYWIQNIRTNEELVLDADNLDEIVKRVGWDKELIRINKIYYRKNKEKSKLILRY